MELPETSRDCWPTSGPNKRPPEEWLVRSKFYKTALLVNNASFLTAVIKQTSATTGSSSSSSAMFFDHHARHMRTWHVRKRFQHSSPQAVAARRYIHSPWYIAQKSSLLIAWRSLLLKLAFSISALFLCRKRCRMNCQLFETTSNMGRGLFPGIITSSPGESICLNNEDNAKI